MTRTLLKRLRAMDGAELKFRAAAALRTRVRRARSALRSPAWEREALRLTPLPGLVEAREALARRDWAAAHASLASHFARRPPLFPLNPRVLDAISARVAAAFPSTGARERADAILAGAYDLLGYRGVAAGSPPDWHRDPIHDRVAPRVFWDAVPYLDPACGDHKITWELNRHQHFLALGRAYALTGDRRYYRVFVSHLTDWIRRNPPRIGTNWASMLELAFRCLSWTWALHMFAGAASRDDEEPWTVDLLVGLDRQLDHIEENLSLYFSPNTHLTGEALALYVTGRVFPELPGSAERAAVGRRILLQEADRQVLADGGHAERSTHYHRYSADFYLLAYAVGRASGDPHAGSFRKPAARQARYLRAIADDAGRVPLIGDDDGGLLFPICGRRPFDCADTLATASVLLDDPAVAVSAAPEETYWFCGGLADPTSMTPAPIPAPSVVLEESGYCVSRNGHGDHLVFDCGEHGYLNGGHAHADALAIVLTIAGRPFLVDPGTATYTMDPELRDRFRSSAMHNTVLVDRQPQSQPSGPFHWKTRTDARCVRWESTPDRDIAAGVHHGFAPFIHTREVTSIHARGWTIVDRVEGPGAPEATALWHFHPEWTLERIDGGLATLLHADGTRAVFMSSVPLCVAAAPGLDEYAPEYGRIEKALCLEGTLRAETPLTIVTVIPADGRLDTVMDLASSVHQDGLPMADRRI